MAIEPMPTPENTWQFRTWMDKIRRILDNLDTDALLASNNLSDLDNVVTARDNLGVEIGADVQAWDADLDTWATKTAPTGTVVGTTDTQTLTNKTFTDSTTTFQDEADTTKKFQFQASSITTGTTRTITVPDANFTIATTSSSQVMSNKTFTDATTEFQDNVDNTKKFVFQCSGITTGTTRTLTVPDGSTTLVGTDTTQTLTNKTLSDSTMTFADQSDNTKKMIFELSGITTGTTRTLTVPDVSDSIVARSSTDTLTNKTLTSPVINSPTGTMTLTSGSLGYSTGNGGTVTQVTNKSTAVSLNKMSGEITMEATTSIASDASVTFTLNNNNIAATDLIIVNHASGGTLGAYLITGRATGSTTASFTVRNVTTGALAEAVVIRFAVFKGATT